MALQKKKETKKYAATIRIPTASKYAYIEIVTEGTPQEIVDSYYSVSETYWKEAKSRAKASGKKIIKSEQ